MSTFVYKRQFVVRCGNSEFFTNDGIIEGEYVLYYPDGNIHIQYTYIDGNRNGRCIIYLPSGKIYYESYFINGEKNENSSKFY